MAAGSGPAQGQAPGDSGEPRGGGDLLRRWLQSLAPVGVSQAAGGLRSEGIWSRGRGAGPARPEVGLRQVCLQDLTTGIRRDAMRSNHFCCGNWNCPFPAFHLDMSGMSTSE